MTQALRMHAWRFRSQQKIQNEWQRLQVFAAAAAVSSPSIIIWRKSLRCEASNSFQLKIDKNTFFTDAGGYAFGHETVKAKNIHQCQTDIVSLRGWYPHNWLGANYTTLSNGAIDVLVGWIPCKLDRSTFVQVIIITIMIAQRARALIYLILMSSSSVERHGMNIEHSRDFISERGKIPSPWRRYDGQRRW